MKTAVFPAAYSPRKELVFYGTAPQFKRAFVDLSEKVKFTEWNKKLRSAFCDFSEIQ